MIDLRCGDCLQEMRKIPDKSIDLVLTDPPYGTTACSWDIIPNLTLLWTEFKRVGKENCAYIFTAGQPFTTDLITCVHLNRSFTGIEMDNNYFNKAKERIENAK